MIYDTPGAQIQKPNIQDAEVCWKNAFLSEMGDLNFRAVMQKSIFLQLQGPIKYYFGEETEEEGLQNLNMPKLKN